MQNGIVFLGTIIVSSPEFGVAIVATAEGTIDIKHMFLAHLPINDGTVGATPQANLVDGTTVICLVDTTSPNKAYIIAPADYAVGDLDNTLAARAMYKVDKYTEANDTVFIDVLSKLLTSRAVDFQNYAHGADIDVLPGDYDVIDINGNAGLHVGRFLAQLRGSPMAFIDISNITDAIRAIAAKIECHMPLYTSVKDKDLIVENIAISVAESLGIKEGIPVKINDGYLEYADENAIPFYRMQKMAGAAVAGSESIVVKFPKDKDAHYSTTEPPILSKQRVSLSGDMMEVSAYGISSIKTPAIRGLHQINYNATGDKKSQSDILQPYDYKSGSSLPTKVDPKQLDIQVSDAVINKIIDTLLTGDYLEKLKQKMAEHGLVIASSKATLVSEIEGKQIIGPTKAQQYGLPPYIILTDPITDKQTVYYNSTSFISQEPDGSISICDGYGSEIRMSRGNIYISPALDLFLRPGRDLSAMVSRHQSFNAQGHTTINSSKSVYIRAIGNLKMVGATGGNGIVSLECRATNTSMFDGLMLVSRCGTSVIGNNIYIGRNSCVGKASGQIEEPTGGGTILIDACSNGTLNQRCGESIVDSKAVYLLASSQGAASAICITPSMTGIYTNQVEMPATVWMVSKKSFEEVSVLRKGNVEKVRLTTNTAPQLVVESSVVVGESLVVNKIAKINGQAQANVFVAWNPEVGGLDQSQGNPFKPEKIDKLPAKESYGKNTAAGAKEMTKYIYQDQYISTNSFAFPDSYGVQDNLRVPGMLWQTQTAELPGTKGRMWKEEAITTPATPKDKETMCYPGFTVWKNAKVSQKGYKTADLNKGYITNITDGDFQ